MSNSTKQFFANVSFYVMGMLVTVGVLWYFGLFKAAESPVKIGAEVNWLQGTTTFSSTEVNFDPATTTEVLAANTGRSYALLTNNDAGVVECAIGAVSTTNKGFYLSASGGTYEIDQSNLFTGAINCIALSATSTIVVIEH